jgi:hypothetical protein
LSATSFPICRAHDLFHPLEEYPLLLRRNPADEVYCLKWDHSFGVAATIRIARLGEEVMATWQHRGAAFNPYWVWTPVEFTSVGARW